MRPRNGGVVDMRELLSWWVYASERAGARQGATAGPGVGTPGYEQIHRRGRFVTGLRYWFQRSAVVRSSYQYGKAAGDCSHGHNSHPHKARIRDPALAGTEASG